MARKTGSSSEKTARAVRLAALRLFAERGYHAVSMRAIAGAVDMQAAALYNYWPTKQHLLLDLMTAHMDELLGALDAAVPTQGAPILRLTAFVRFHIRHHMRRPAAVFVSYMELRSLEPDNFDRLASLRRAYESRLRDILDAGSDEGAFIFSDAKMTTLGIIALLTGLTTWYRPNGRLSAAEIEDMYVEMTARMVGMDPPAGAQGRIRMFYASMTFDLGDDVAALRDAAHRWAQERLKPMAGAIDRDNRFPAELWREMGDMGLLGVTVDEEHGGAGLGYLAHTVAVEEIARASASVSLSYGAHSNLCVNQLRLNGTPEQKARYLPGLVSGEHVGALAMSEAGAGSDVVSMRLRAEKRNDRYVLNGSKYWITNGPDADTLIVYAKTDPDAGPKGITAFIIEKSMHGFSVSPHFDKLGMRGSNTGELIFDDVEVPFENVLGEEGRGVAVLMSGLDYERVVLAGIGLGIMAACLDEVMPYVRERKQFGRPIGEFQLMQAKIADMYTAMNSARAYVYEVARACDRGQVTRQDAAACVLYASEQAMVQAHQAVQALGGAGFLNDSAVSRLFRDAKLMEIGAGTSEIRRMLVGRELMKAEG